MRDSDLSRTVGDFVAGLLVALVGVPQCLAYALLSGVPPIYGLATAAVPGVIGAVFGKSSRVTVGPTNTTGLIILVSLTPFIDASGSLTADGLIAMATLAAMAGLVRLLIGLFKVERIFDFIPEAVLIGFGAGAAFLIAFMQLDEAMGVKFFGVQNLVDEAISFSEITNFSESVKWPAVTIAVGAVLASLVMRRVAPKVPTPLILLVGVTAVTMSLGLDTKTGVPLVGGQDEVVSGWPVGELPFQNLQMIGDLFLPALAIAFIGTLELLITLKNNRESSHLNQEIKAQGLANLVGSCFSAFPASTSLTRSALLGLSGAQTRLAPIFAALLVIPLLFYAGPLIGFIPQSLIAGLLFATAVSMLDVRAIRNVLRATRSTKLLFLTTFFATLTMSFHMAIILGCLLGFVIFLFQASSPQIHCYGVQDNGDLAENKKESHIMIQVSGSLYYAAARALPERVSLLLTNEIERVTLDLSHSHHLRYTAALALEEIDKAMRSAELPWHIVGASSSFEKMCRKVSTTKLPFTKRITIKQSIVEDL